MTMIHLAPYNAAPRASEFRPVTLDELRAIKAEIDDAGRHVARRDGDFFQQAAQRDVDIAETAVILATAGIAVLVARDEDGYYFATPATPIHLDRLVWVKRGTPIWPPHGYNVYDYFSDGALCNGGAYLGDDEDGIGLATYDAGTITPLAAGTYYRIHAYADEYVVVSPETGTSPTFPSFVDAVSAAGPGRAIVRRNGEDYAVLADGEVTATTHTEKLAELGAHPTEIDAIRDMEAERLQRGEWENALRAYRRSMACALATVDDVIAESDSAIQVLLSAPNRGGYREVLSHVDALAKISDWIGDAYVTREDAQGVIYYYATDADADADATGERAVATIKEVA